MLPYIKKHYADFSISDCFQSTRLGSRRIAEKDFKRCISQILSNEVKATDPVYNWARNVQHSEYAMLTSLEAEKHWRDLSTRHANRAVAAAHRKEALKKKESQTETDEEARSKEKDSSIEDSPRRSKRKHARSIKEGFYAETEGTVDDDVVSPRKVQKFHWLVGGGNEEEETCAGCSKNEWIVGMSVSQLLKEHRRKVLTLAEDEDLIEVDHMLALNNIYYFPRSRSKGVWKVLPKSIHDQVNNDLHVSEGIQNLPDKAVMMCRKLNKIAQQSPDDLEERLLKEYLYALDDPDLKQFVRCLHRLFLNYEDVSDIEDLQEQQFTDQALMPFIRFAFPKSEVKSKKDLGSLEFFKIDGPTTSSKAIKEAYGMIDPSLIALIRILPCQKMVMRLLGEK